MYRPTIARIGCRIFGCHTRQHGSHYSIRKPSAYQVKPINISQHCCYRTDILTKDRKQIDVQQILHQPVDVHDPLNLLDLQDPLTSSIVTLSALCKLSEHDREVALADPKFIEMVDWFTKHRNDLSPPDVIRCLKYFLILYPDEDPEIIINLEKCFKSFGGRMSVNHLNEYVQSHEGQNTTGLRKEAYKRSKKQLLLRWAEVGESSLLISLLYQADEQDMKNLEIKAMELASKMSPNHLYKFLCALDHHKRHNAPLIRALLYHLNLTWKESSWTFNKLVKLAQVCANLNIYNETLFRNWSSVMSDHVKNDDPVSLSKASILSCVKSVGSLRWHDEEVINSIVGVLLHQGKLSSQNLSYVLAMCATVNYLPQQLREKLPQLCADLSSDYITTDPRSYLEIVWNLCVLEAFGDSRIPAENILSANSIDHLKSTSRAEVYPAACVKLMNISSTIKLDMSGDDKPLLPDDFLSQNGVQVPVRKHRPLVNIVKAALSEVYPEKKFMRHDLQSPLGYKIDIEMLVDAEGKPCPLATEQPNLTRLAVKVLEFPDMTLNEGGSIGRYCMMERHLTKTGHKVIMIPYKEMADLDTTVKLVRYLETKLQIKKKYK